jgi:hypothetical protein
MSDYSPLAYSLEFLVSLAISAFLLVWFYRAVKRIENSLREVKERLESPAGFKPIVPHPPSSPSPSPKGTKERERISNLWGIPAVIFLVAAFGGYSLLGAQLAILMFQMAGATAIGVAVWEVVRRRI